MSTGKKVLYISYDGMTDPLGQSQVIPYLRELTKQGYRFTILSVEKKKQLLESGEQIRQLLARIGIQWEILTFSRHPPVFSKMYDQWKLTAAAARLHKQENFDLIHCRSYVAAQAGLRLLNRFDAPFLFDMRGFWVDERVDSGHWKTRNPLYRFLYKLYKKKEKKYLREAAHIISLTKKGREELINTYAVPAEKVTVIPCCVDLEHFDYHKIGQEEKQEARKWLGLSNNNNVLSYLGSLGGWYMTGEMLDFFVVVKKKMPGTKFLFITHGSKKQIISKAVAKGISETDILVQPATREEVPLYLSISDWSVFFIKNVYSKKASSPTKQGEIMAMGIPVICNDIGDTGKIVTVSAAGILIDDFSPEGYEKAAGSLANLLQVNKLKLRESAYDYYDLQKGVAAYRQVYEQMTGQGANSKNSFPKL